MIRISEGVVNNYLIPGVFLVIGGIICIVLGAGQSPWLWIGGILLIAVAILLFTATSGMEIDEKALRFRKYGKFGPLVIGYWKSIPQGLEIRILINIESTQRNGAGAIPVPDHSSRVLTYEVASVDTLNHATRLYGFMKYTNAKKAGKILSEIMDVTLNDIVSEKLARNRSRRR